MQNQSLSNSKSFDINKGWRILFNSAHWSGVVVLTRSVDCHPAERYMHVSFSTSPVHDGLADNRSEVALKRQNVRLYLPFDKVLHHRALVLIHDDSEALNFFDIDHLT